MSQGPIDCRKARNQSPYTAFPKSLLIRRDLVKMAKALRAEINDVVAESIQSASSKRTGR